MTKNAKILEAAALLSGHILSCNEKGNDISKIRFNFFKSMKEQKVDDYTASDIWLKATVLANECMNIINMRRH